MGLWTRFRGNQVEDRALTRDNVPPSMLPYGARAAGRRPGQRAPRRRRLRVRAADRERDREPAAEGVPQDQRRPAPAGDDQRLVQLLRRPAPGSTKRPGRPDLVSLHVYGDSFIGKFRGADNEIAQLALLHADRLQVELRGQRSSTSWTADRVRARRHPPRQGPERRWPPRLVPGHAVPLGARLSANLQETPSGSSSRAACPPAS